MGRSNTYMLGLGTFVFSLVLIIESTKLALSSNIKVRLSASKKKMFNLLQWQPFKNDVFNVLTFWSYIKNGLIEITHTYYLITHKVNATRQ